MYIYIIYGNVNSIITVVLEMLSMKNCTFSDRWQYIIETGVNVAETEDSVSSFMQYKKQEIENPNTELQKGREA